MSFRDRFRNSMSGRYGNDTLNRFILGAALVLLVIELFTGSIWLYILTAVLIIWGWYRSFSRNISARQRENEKFVGAGRRIRDFFSGGMRAAKDPSHAYFRCPNCHQMVRVPKGKGHIQITCPRCHSQFIRET